MRKPPEWRKYARYIIGRESGAFCLGSLSTGCMLGGITALNSTEWTAAAFLCVLGLLFTGIAVRYRTKEDE